jgi:hypothetical protein
MTPLETIKEGILTNNIVLIAEGYNRITGESIFPPQKRLPPEPPGRRENYRPSQDDQFDSYDDPFDNGDPKNYRPKDNEVAARVEPFVPRRRVNMWGDEGERTPDYTEADKRADEDARTKRQAPRREPYTPVTVNCDGCGKRFNVNPILVVGKVYRCDRCSNNSRR